MNSKERRRIRRAELRGETVGAAVAERPKANILAYNLVRRWIDETDVGDVIVLLAPAEAAELLREELERTKKQIGVHWVEPGEPFQNYGDHLLRFLFEVRPKTISVNVWPKIQGEHAEWTEQALTIAQGIANRYRTNVVTVALKCRQFVWATIRNAPAYPGSVDVSALLGELADSVLNPVRRVIVVGGGASLPDALPAIIEARTNGAAWVFAVDRALPVLTEAGIVPDVVCTIDINPQKAGLLRDYCRKFRELGARPAPLLIQQQYTHPRITAAWSGDRGFVGSRDWPMSRHLPRVHDVGETLSVGNLAVRLALAVRPSHVFLAGMDFNDGETGQWVWPGHGGRVVRLGDAYHAMVTAMDADLKRAHANLLHMAPRHVRFSESAEFNGWPKGVHAPAPVNPFPMELPRLEWRAGLRRHLEALRAAPAALNEVVLFDKGFAQGERALTDTDRAKAEAWTSKAVEIALRRIQ